MILFKKYRNEKNKKDLPVTGGLVQAGVWLARKLVRICKFCARPSGGVTPACAKPPPR